MEEIKSLDDVLKEVLISEGDLLGKQAAIRIGDLQKDVAIREQAIVQLMAELRTLREDKERLEGAVEFYADPHTYFAVAVIVDTPCGDFDDDFSDTEELGIKPGKRARETLAALTAAKEPDADAS